MHLVRNQDVLAEAALSSLTPAMTASGERGHEGQVVSMLVEQPLPQAVEAVYGVSIREALQQIAQEGAASLRKKLAAEAP